MHRFYFRDTHRENALVQLDEAESKHAAQVLRLKKDDPIILLNGLGGVYDAVVEEVGGKPNTLVTARILGPLPDNEPKTRVTLYQGLPKADKLETILQKCTELGVHALQPVQFARSVKEIGKNTEKTLLRLRRVAKEAAKQCGRGQIPLVGQSKLFSEVLDRLREHRLVLVAWEESTQDMRLQSILRQEIPQEIALVIGPEGGITPEEIEQLRSIGAKTVSLGPRILRTETAGMAALASIFTLTGDM